VYLLSSYAAPSEHGILLARLITAAFGLGCVWLTYQIGAHLSNPAGGFVASLLLAVTSFFALHSFFISMEIFMVFAMLAGLLLLLTRDTRRLGPILAAGIALGLAVSFKEVALLFVLWGGGYILFLRRREFRRVTVSLAALLLPTGLGLVGWGAGAWKLSPDAFAATMNRWVSSMAATNLLDPRVRVNALHWAQQITDDLLGPALVVGVTVSLLIQLGRLKWRPPGAPWLTPTQGLLWGYFLSAIVISFGVRLKELRHLIGILPIACLLIGTSVDWQALAGNVLRRRNWAHKAIFSAAIAIFLLSASPLRWPVGPVTSVASWLDPSYGWRVLENDRFYNVLRLTGLYLKEHTDPSDVITVAHQATVTAYYADRHYLMLYTLRNDAIERILAQTQYLVWDDEDFQALTRAEVAELRHRVEQRFTLSAVIHDGSRAVKVYRR
ncbi:MAG: hypothetical protein QG637_349, partial [Chloroflexota bacterium]|nr:hypothetical protein [Chloroflexota bacterium]